MSDDTPTSPPVDPVAERRTAVRRALARHAAKLARKLEALRGDLAEAERGPEWQRMSDALYAYMAQVPARSAVARLPDPHAPDTTLEVPLDPAVTPAVNAARYAKRAAKAQRGLSEIPPRITAVTREHHELTGGIELARLAHEAERAVPAGTPAPAEVVAEAEESHLRLERVLAGLSEGTRRAIRAPEPLPRRKLGLTGEAAPRAQRSPTTPAPQKGGRPPLQGKFVPWRYRTREGWDVLIGRSSEANDHLTLHLARPEDYWFHAHGCPGSHPGQGRERAQQGDAGGGGGVGRVPQQVAQRGQGAGDLDAEEVRAQAARRQAGHGVRGARADDHGAPRGAAARPHGGCGRTRRRVT
ncbi:MAG: hypothetical protein RL721_1410 [Candidatus Eisenbacteria bacterium]